MDAYNGPETRAMFAEIAVHIRKLYRLFSDTPTGLSNEMIHALHAVDKAELYLKRDYEMLWRMAEAEKDMKAVATETLRAKLTESRARTQKLESLIDSLGVFQLAPGSPILSPARPGTPTATDAAEDDATIPHLHEEGSIVLQI